MRRLIPGILLIAAIGWVIITSVLTWTAHAFGAAPPSPTSTRIVISIPQHRLYLYQDNRLFHSYPVAVGKPLTKSPRGEFYITQKAVWGDGFGTRWMRISVPWGIYGIHGTDKPWTVGTAASHGCFRMLNRNVEQVYALVSLHTPVVIEGYEPFTRIRRDLALHAIGQDVVELQRLLRFAKVYAGPLSGVYTEEVKASVQKFQLMVGLDATGNATLATTHQLQEYTHQGNLRPKYLGNGSGS